MNVQSQPTNGRIIMDWIRYTWPIVAFALGAAVIAGAMNIRINNNTDGVKRNEDLSERNAVVLEKIADRMREHEISQANIGYRLDRIEKDLSDLKRSVSRDSRLMPPDEP